MARVGVKYMLRYHRNNLDYKRTEHRIDYKNWTIDVHNNIYMIKFTDEKLTWNVQFRVSSIVCASRDYWNIYNISIIRRCLQHMDLLELHQRMIEGRFEV